LHVALPPVAIETWMEAMADVHRAGLIRAVGVSNYSVEQMQRAHNALAKHGIPLATNQVKFSLIDREPIENGLLDACRELGITLIAYSPLGKGILSGKYTPENRPGGMRGRRFSPQIFATIAPLLAALRDIAELREKTMAQVAINWCIAKGTLPIPGAKTGAQARENAGALGWSLTEDEVGRLDGAL
ncbi:MAG: aldo/keto reductase, partial [bacterium]